MKKREGKRREEEVVKREEEDNEVECKGWGTSGMSALPRVCVCVCMWCVCVSQTYAAASELNHTPANCFETPLLCF